MKRAKIEAPLLLTKGTQLCSARKIEISANERAVFISLKAAFSFTSTPIVSLTICLYSEKSYEMSSDINICLYFLRYFTIQSVINNIKQAPIILTMTIRISCHHSIFTPNIKIAIFLKI